jgi:pre-mRNA-processing factor 40
MQMLTLLFFQRLRRERLSRERTTSPRGKARSKTPQITASAKEEDRALRSGSEEGEIEED